MFAINPFAALSPAVSPGVMQAYLVIMIILVAAGTLFDIVHKGSAKYFFDNWRKSKGKAKRGRRRRAGVDRASRPRWSTCSPRASSATRSAASRTCSPCTASCSTSSPPRSWCSATRRRTPTPRSGRTLWWIGGLMVLVGGYWFWFFIRVDVAAEGNSPFRVMHADLFILSLLASVTLGLHLGLAAGGGMRACSSALYILATTVLFGGVPWSKFAHMFFKPAAAFEKRVSEANGTAENLPTLTRDDPEQQKRHSMELLQRRPDGHGARHQARSAPPLLETASRSPTHAYLRLHDEVRRMRTLRRHLSLGHHAHRQDLSARLQHRAEHVLGVLLLREGLPAERDRRARLCRLRPARPQRSRRPRRKERHDRLEDQVPQRHGKELPVAHHHQALGDGDPQARGGSRTQQGNARRPAPVQRAEMDPHG